MENKMGEWCSTHGTDVKLFNFSVFLMYTIYFCPWHRIQLCKTECGLSCNVIALLNLFFFTGKKFSNIIPNSSVCLIPRLSSILYTIYSESNFRFIVKDCYWKNALRKPQACFLQSSCRFMKDWFMSYSWKLIFHATYTTLPWICPLLDFHYIKHGWRIRMVYGHCFSISLLREYFNFERTSALYYFQSFIQTHVLKIYT
jgi:hypothetical protein